MFTLELLPYMIPRFQRADAIVVPVQGVSRVLTIWQTYFRCKERSITLNVKMQRKRNDCFRMKLYEI